VRKHGGIDVVPRRQLEAGEHVRQIERVKLPGADRGERLAAQTAGGHAEKEEGPARKGHTARLKTKFMVAGGARAGQVEACV